MEVGEEIISNLEYEGCTIEYPSGDGNVIYITTPKGETWKLQLIHLKK